MKCKQCGREIPEDSRFCAYCGCALEAPPADYILPRVIKAAPQAAAPQPPADEAPAAAAPRQAPVQPDPAPQAKEPQAKAPQPAPAPEKAAPQPGPAPKKEPPPAQPPLQKPQLETETEGDTLWDAIAGQMGVFWKKLDWFFRICLIAGGAALVLLLLALLLGKTAPVIFSVLQLAAALVCALMHAKVWKLPDHRKNVPYFVLAAILPVLILCLWSFAWGGEKADVTPPPAPADTPAPTAAPAEDRVQAPLAEQDCVGKPYTAVEQAFLAAGFEQVSSHPIEDLRFDQADQQKTVESVSIHDSRDFAAQQNFAPTDPVVIRYHVYKKCRVAFRADVKKNLLFSKYDVDVLIDGSPRGTIPHGEGMDFDFELEPGLHILTFRKAGADQPAAEIKLDVKGETRAQFALTCARSALTAETLQLTDMGLVDESHAMLPDTLFTVEEFDYEVLIQEFDIAGFTNILLEPVYDVPADSEQLGRVAQVTVDGRTDFAQGEILAKDTPILIQYHADEAQAPAAN